MIARVLAVEVHQFGSELAVDASGGATSLVVADAADFEPDGGFLQIGDEVLDYTAVNETTDTITLGSPTVGAFAAETPVTLHPLATELVAHIVATDTPEPAEDMEARVPHALYDRLPLGQRTTGVDAESVVVEFDGDELVVTDVMGQRPAVDASFLSNITPVTLEPESDGAPPGASPDAMVKGGVNFLVIQWDVVANADPVTYEVHLSATTGFTPSAATLMGEVRGTMFFARHLPDATPLAYDTSYYARLVAKDADGAAAPGVEGEGQLNKDGTGDIIVGNVTAEKMEAMLVLATTLVAGTPEAMRVELGVSHHDGQEMIGLHAFAEDGSTVTFMLDAMTGEVYIKGRVDWGMGSRLTADDILELQEQPSGAFQIPALVQSAGSGNSGATATATWPVATVAGNQPLLVLVINDVDNTSPTPTTPTGWTLVESRANGAGLAIFLYRATTGASRSGVESITLNDTCEWTTTIYEYSGVTVGGVDKTVDNQGTSTSPDSGTTATTTQAEELWFGALATVSAPGQNTSITSPTNGFSEVRGQGYIRPGGGGVKQTTFAKVVSGTGTVNVGGTLAQSLEWIGLAVALTAKASGVDAPEANKARLYAKDVSAIARPHVMHEDGTDAAVMMGTAGEVWRYGIYTVNYNIPNIGANSNSAEALTFAGGSFKAGDEIVALYPTALAGGLIVTGAHARTVGTDDQATITLRNITGAGIDDITRTFVIHVIHRS